ncbi:hypothetical protein Q7A53_11330 [Halobacillus rhizosphaerae]|uniref:hypothetical protein n=1 Tax=Halobacillus rhizosphaerae TaxID=3064889 RepID=UPI00398B4985
MVSNGIFVLAVIGGLIILPLMMGFLRDAFGSNSNRFYGDELNKTKKSKRGERLDKGITYAHSESNHFMGGGSFGDGGDQ